MKLESHHAAMSAPITRERMHRISDIDAPILRNTCHGDCNQGRNCPARQACELPEPDPEAWIESLIPPFAAYGAMVLAAAVAMALILSPYFLNR